MIGGVFSVGGVMNTVNWGTIKDHKHSGNDVDNSDQFLESIAFGSRIKNGIRIQN